MCTANAMRCLNRNRIASIWLSIALLFSFNHCLLGSCRVHTAALNGNQADHSGGCHHAGPGTAGKKAPKSACGDCCRPSLISERFDHPAPTTAATEPLWSPIIAPTALTALIRRDEASSVPLVLPDPPGNVTRPILASLSLAPNAPPRVAISL